MGRTPKEKIATLPPQRRARVERRASELINEELSLRELRRALGRTQSKLANDLQVGQDTVARYEQRSDMLLSTLNRYACIVLSWRNILGLLNQLGASRKES